MNVNLDEFDRAIRLAGQMMIVVAGFWISLIVGLCTM